MLDYSADVGYVDEITAISTADTGSMTEKTREMAKIAAKMPYSSEMVEDASIALNWFRTKAQQYILNKVDSEIFAGDGNDTTAPKHIYGLKVSEQLLVDVCGVLRTLCTTQVHQTLLLTICLPLCFLCLIAS